MPSHQARPQRKLRRPRRPTIIVSPPNWFHYIDEPSEDDHYVSCCSEDSHSMTATRTNTSQLVELWKVRKATLGRLHPQTIQTQFRLGQALYRQQQYKESLYHFTKALQNEQDRWSHRTQQFQKDPPPKALWKIMYWLAYSHLQMKEYSQAQIYFHQLLEYSKRQDPSFMSPSSTSFEWYDWPSQKGSCHPIDPTKVAQSSSQPVVSPQRQPQPRSLPQSLATSIFWMNYYGYFLGIFTALVGIIILLLVGGTKSLHQENDPIFVLVADRSRRNET